MKRFESLLSEIDEFEKRYPTFKGQIKIYKMLLKVQRPLLEDTKRGTTIDPIAKEFLDELQDRSLKEGKALSSFLKPSIFDLKALHKTFLAVIEEGERLNIEEFKKLRFLENTSKLIPEFIERRLGNGYEFFLSLANKFGLPNKFLETIVDMLVQPLMKSLANNVKKEGFLDNWNKTICPICNRIPFIVVKNEEEVWRFHCTFCEAEYAMNIFKCPNCEDEDFRKKGYFFIERREAFEVTYCKVCNSYFKVINQYKLKENIPIGLEDLYTNFLDEVAQSKNLKRLDTLGPRFEEGNG